MSSSLLRCSSLRALPSKAGVLVSQILRSANPSRKSFIATGISRATGKRMTSPATAIEDNYPTRFVKEPVVLPRADPVVWGRHGKDGLLTQEDLANYEKYGFVILKDVFTGKTLQDLTDDVTSRRDGIEADLASMGQDNNLLRKCSSGFYLLESKSRRLRTIKQIFRHIPLVNKLARYPPLLASIKQILDDEVYIIQDRINFQAAFDGEGFQWHSDFEAWHSEDGVPRPRALNVMVMLSTNTPQNGAVMVIPGTHWHFIGCPAVNPKYNLLVHLQTQRYGVPDRNILRDLVERNGIAYCTGEPGTVVLTDANIIHGSHSNISPQDRCNLFLVYNAVSNKTNSPYAGTPIRPEYMHTRDPEWMKPLPPWTIQD